MQMTCKQNFPWTSGGQYRYSNEITLRTYDWTRQQS